MVIFCPNLANLKGQNMNGIRGGFNTRPHFFQIFFPENFPNNKQSKTDQLDAAFFSNFSYQLPHTVFLHSFFASI